MPVLAFIGTGNTGSALARAAAGNAVIAACEKNFALSIKDGP